MPLGALWLFDEYRVRNALHQFRREAYLWAPNSSGTGLLVAVNLLTRRPWSAGRICKSARWDIQGRAGNLYAYALYLTFPIPFAVVWLAMHWRRAPTLLVLPTIPVIVFHFALSPSTSLTEEWPTAAALTV